MDELSILKQLRDKAFQNIDSLRLAVSVNIKDEDSIIEDSVKTTVDSHAVSPVSFPKGVATERLGSVKLDKELDEKILSKIDQVINDRILQQLKTHEEILLSRVSVMIENCLERINSQSHSNKIPEQLLPPVDSTPVLRPLPSTLISPTRSARSDPSPTNRNLSKPFPLARISVSSHRDAPNPIFKNDIHMFNPKKLPAITSSGASERGGNSAVPSKQFLPPIVGEKKTNNILDGVRYSHCRSTVYGPSTASHIRQEAPRSAQLQLQSVIGCSSSKLLYLNGGSIASAIGCVVCITTFGSKGIEEGQFKQSFFHEHTGIITCIALHPNKITIVSAQENPPRMLLWESSEYFQSKEENEEIQKDDCILEITLNPGLQKGGILTIDFSPDGRLIMILSRIDRWLNIIDLKSNEYIISTQQGTADIKNLYFNPSLYWVEENDTKNDTIVECCYTFVSITTKQIKFWILTGTLIRADISSNIFIDEKKKIQGRKLAVPKSKQQWTTKYTVDGSTATFGRIKPTITELPDLTCICFAQESKYLKRLDTQLPKCRVITGTSHGSIEIWEQAEDDAGSTWLAKGHLLTVVTDLHETPIRAICQYRFLEDDQNDFCLISSCSQDSEISLWALKDGINSSEAPLDLVACDNGSFGNNTLGIGLPKQLLFSPQGDYILVATDCGALCIAETACFPDGNHSNEEVDVVSLAFRVLCHGHSYRGGSGEKGKVRRLAMHTYQDTQLLACLSLSGVMLRDVSTGRLLTCSPPGLVDGAVAICFCPVSPCSLAVGQQNGEVLVVEYQSVESSGGENWSLIGRRNVTTNQSESAKVKERVSQSSINRRTEVTELRYSPSGHILAVGAKNSLIHLLDATNDLRRIGICRGHSSGIQKLDFSRDGCFLQSADVATEILFWDTSTGKQIQTQKSRNVSWSTWTCHCGWPVQGIHNGTSGQLYTVCRSYQEDLLVVGGGSSTTSVGFLKLFQYPCSDMNTLPLWDENYVHGSPVIDVVWTADGVNVISVSVDGYTFIWNCLIN